MQTASLLAHLWGKGIQGPFLIVAPVSTLANWMKELATYAFTTPLPVLMFMCCC